MGILFLSFMLLNLQIMVIVWVFFVLYPHSLTLLVPFHIGPLYFKGGIDSQEVMCMREALDMCPKASVDRFVKYGSSQVLQYEYECT